VWQRLAIFLLLGVSWKQSVESREGNYADINYFASWYRADCSALPVRDHNRNSSNEQMKTERDNDRFFDYLRRVVVRTATRDRMHRICARMSNGPGILDC
jgi:hypothetical protein